MSELVPAIPPAIVRHDLPSGGWVELRDHTLLRAKALKRVIRNGNIARDAAGGLDIEMGFSITDNLIAILVTAWEVPYEPEPAEDGTVRDWVLPSVDMSIVDELSAPDFSLLQELINPARQLLFPGKADPSDAEDPTSPTEPASA